MAAESVVNVMVVTANHLASEIMLLRIDLSPSEGVCLYQ